MAINDIKETSWNFYVTPKEAWDAMLTTCKEAQSSIDLEQFIFCTDEIGNQFIDICRAKAKEGVRVRILCDAAGSFGFYNSTIPQSLRDDGVRIAFFNTLVPGGKHNHTPWLFRDHQKLLVIDNVIAFTGSLALWESTKNWRETHVRIEGDVVPTMTHSFNQMWERAFKNKTRDKNLPPSTTSGFNYITNAPLPGKRYLYHSLIDAIRSARKYIYFTTPYFVPDQRCARVLKLAARRGVDVRILIPHTSDHPIVDYGSQSHFTKMLENGIRIFRYKNSMIHAKTGTIDSEWSTLGSLNLDHLSFLYNFEGNIVSTNKKFAEDIKQQFVNDLEKSQELTLTEWKKRSLLQKFLEAATWPIRKIL
ncbi:MAG: hypothetical protein EXS50_01860 [Candidatus Taylorbacteria bacterium]|nr:hypothetical protein [Candidatus Taylorbacteria bacterium]